MAEFGPPKRDVWEELEEILGSIEDLPKSNDKAPNTSLTSSCLQTETVMRPEAPADNREAYSVVSTYNCVSDTAPLPKSVRDSYDELGNLIRRMGYKLEWEQGKRNIQHMFDALQMDSDLDMSADFNDLDFKKALRNFNDLKTTPKHLFPMLANVLAKIGIILARSYKQLEPAVEFCNHAHTYFRNSSDLTPEDLEVLHDVRKTYLHFASWYHGNRDTKNAINCWQMQEDVKATMQAFGR